MKCTSQKFILFIVVLLGLGAIAAYAIPALATSFGDDVTVSKRLILNSSNSGLLNQDQFQIFSGDTPVVRLHQDTTGIYPDQIWDLQANETAMYFYDATGAKRPFLVRTGAPSHSLVVNTSGNVGIGTTNPTSLLSWKGKLLDITGSSADAAIVLHDAETTQESAVAGSGMGLYIDVGGHTDASNNDIIFSTGRTNSSYTLTEAMRINNDGNVGIGTVGPGHRLSVVGSASVSNESGGDVAYFGQITTANPKQLLIESYPGSNYVGIMGLQQGIGYNQNLVLQRNGGNVGIGTTNPTNKLEVNGAVRMVPTGAPANPTRGTIYYDVVSNHFFGFNGVWKQLDN